MAKYCGNCGRELSDEAKFCPNCVRNTFQGTRQIIIQNQKSLTVHLMILITEALQILLKALPKRVLEMIRETLEMKRNFLLKRYA
jgi:RNA polymerase subunit RPABC4/transcription elongation factor Spt4